MPRQRQAWTHSNSGVVLVLPLAMIRLLFPRRGAHGPALPNATLWIHGWCQGSYDVAAMGVISASHRLHTGHSKSNWLVVNLL